MTFTRKPDYAFVVPGRPVSSQASGSSQKRYRQSVANAARYAKAKTANSSTRMGCDVDWFTADLHNSPDADNIIKPIQDALKGIVYDDDKQVMEVSCKKHHTTSILEFIDESLEIVEPLLEGCHEYVFIRIFASDY